MSAPPFKSVNHPNPAEYALAVVTDTTFDTTTRGVYVGGTGNLSVRFANGTDVVFINVQAGSVIPVRATRVNASGTTATNMVAMF